uniref:Uncharacterized protein n=1 Tax=Rhizobium rhizogenes TaxID=359 RepID=A0A7S4ZRD1_RHIRH|nr:hypothetical protein pC5.7b_265 [Rhizobium rhizogenes]QCL09515.1 hypothetical protein pC5.8a_23 [Rhizobium rhizogenes]
MLFRSDSQEAVEKIIQAIGSTWPAVCEEAGPSVAERWSRAGRQLFTSYVAWVQI